MIDHLRGEPGAETGTVNTAAVAAKAPGTEATWYPINAARISTGPGVA